MGMIVVNASLRMEKKGDRRFIGIQTQARRTSNSTDVRQQNMLHTLLQQRPFRSEEHTSELQSLMRLSYAVFCLKNKTIRNQQSCSISTPRQHNILTSQTIQVTR